MTLRAEREEPSAIASTKENEAAARKDDLGFDLPSAAKPSKMRIVAAVFVFIAVIGAAFVVGWLPKRRARAELAESTR